MSSIVPFLAEASESFFFPPAASTTTSDVDTPFYVILGVGCFFFTLIMSLIALFILRYRKRLNGPKADQNITHNTKIEIAWSIIPLLILIGIFSLGYRGYLHMAVPPRDAIEIHVIAQKWSWSFEYPESGASSVNEMAVPAGRPVRLVITSRDVIHSFFVPSFRLKMDALPNGYTNAWFEATKDSIGKTQQVYCTEYCGTNHSLMLAKIVVKTPEEYEAWLQQHADKSGTPKDRGAKIFAKSGCSSCHAVESPEKQPTPVIGPRLYRSFGRTEQLTDGSSVVVDENYIRRSLEDPNAQLVAGFGAGQMPVFKGRLKDQELADLIEYIKSLK